MKITDIFKNFFNAIANAFSSKKESNDTIDTEEKYQDEIKRIKQEEPGSEQEELNSEKKIFEKLNEGSEEEKQTGNTYETLFDDFQENNLIERETDKPLEVLKNSEDIKQNQENNQETQNQGEDQQKDDTSPEL